MQLGFYFDQTRCIGCFTCLIACRDWYDIQENAEKWIDIRSIETGRYPNISIKHLFITCWHCSKPFCIPVCPVNAIRKREEDGIVLVNKEKCIGSDKCGSLCKKACPFNVPQFGPDLKMQKCNLCLERLKENKKPICVDSCPMRAIDVGDINELKEKFKFDEQYPEVLKSPKQLMPSVLINLKKL